MKRIASFIIFIFRLGVTLTLLSTIFYTSNIYAAPYSLHNDENMALQSRESFGNPNDIQWDTNNLSIDTDTDPHHPILEIKGRHARPSSAIVINGKKIEIAEDQKFAAKIPILKRTTELKVTAIDPYGQVSKQTLLLDYKNWDNYLREKSEAKKNRFMIGLGVSEAAYQETGFEDLHQLSIVAKAGWNRILVPGRLDFGLSGYLTALALKDSRDTNIRYLGFSGKLTYVTDLLANPWQFSLAGGIYYTTSFVPEDEFGFKYLYGPMVMPILRHFMGNGQSAMGYLKYSPVTDNFAFSYSNELAIGGAYTFPLRNQKTFSVTLDIAQLSLQFSDTANITSRSYSLGIGYSW